MQVQSASELRRQPGDRPVEVSVVIPCLNEARSLGACIKKAQGAFKDAQLNGEVVVADNGSTDGSIGIAEELGARVVHAPIKGYGSALRKGIEEAKGSFIIMGDADGSYDFSALPRFVDQWRKGFKLVLGDRFKGEIKPGAMPWHHKYIGNPMLTAILNLFFGAGIGDVYCGMRGFTPDLYHDLDIRTTGMEFAVEFVLKAAKRGTAISEIPITLWPDKRGRPPHLRSLPDGWRTLRLMLLCAPNWLFLVPGGSLTVVGISIVLWLFPGPRQVGRVVFDLHSMLFGMLFVLLGVQIISIGLFAKVFSYAEHLGQGEPTLEGWLRRIKLEHGLAAGGSLALAGFMGDAWVFWHWASLGFGPLQEIRTVILASLCLFVGVQIIFSSFFLSMLGISRGTYIGDYEVK